MSKSNVFEGSAFLPQTNGEISNSITQNWTQQALECWELCGDCTKCSIKQAGFSFVCQMPKVIDQLVKTIGEPIIEQTA